MKRILSYALSVILLLSLFGCREKELASSSNTKSGGIEAETKAADVEEIESISRLIPRYVIKNNRPYIIWDEIVEADKYKV